jgi:ubiquinone/menaquinone biosynthesis C-methylase UbiE
MAKLPSILERINSDNKKFGKLVYFTFNKWVKSIKINHHSQVLSVSTGNGIWDYLAFKNQPKISEIIATDIVNNPVAKTDQKILNDLGKWSFSRVIAEKPLPFSDGRFDLIFHLDVIEHVLKPYSFLTDQYRLLKDNGYLIIGTPNLFRPTNMGKLLVGKLKYPANLGEIDHLGKYIHVQEFSQTQLKNMLQEIGYTIIEEKSCFFGLQALNFEIKDFPASQFGKTFCQYLMFLCQKV